MAWVILALAAWLVLALAFACLLGRAIRLAELRAGRPRASDRRRFIMSDNEAADPGDPWTGTTPPGPTTRRMGQ
jgi:hypothetical protein